MKAKMATNEQRSVTIHIYDAFVNKLRNVRDC